MKPLLREKATTLRQNGRSIKQIARHLSVSPSTVSRWVSDVTLSKAQKSHLRAKQMEAAMKALRPWVQKNRKRKVLDVKKQSLQGKNDVGHVSNRDLYMLGLGLYWGEGYKRGSQECGFTNSDPAVITLILKWFKTSYNIPITQIIARITINDRYRGREDLILKEWSKVTGIPTNQFGKPTFIHGYGKAGRPDETYRGTLRIKVRNGTSLRRRILASISALT